MLLVALGTAGLVFTQYGGLALRSEDPDASRKLWALPFGVMQMTLAVSSVSGAAGRNKTAWAALLVGALALGWYGWLLLAGT